MFGIGETQQFEFGRKVWSCTSLRNHFDFQGGRTGRDRQILRARHKGLMMREHNRT